MELLTEQSSERSTTTAGFFLQTRLLLKKNWLSKIRMERKKLVGELLVPILYLVLLCFLVRMEKRHEYLAETTSYETKQNVTTSLHSQIIIHIVPDTTYARNFTTTMNVIYLSEMRSKNVSQNSGLNFVFHADEAELLDQYRKTEDVLFALIFPNGSEIRSYTVRINPDYYLPSINKKKEELSTCRGRSTQEPGLELSITCPVNGYFYSNFLALQSLADQAIINMAESDAADSDKTLIEVTMENYPKTKYEAGMSTLLRVLIPIYSVIPLSQLINNMLVLIVTEKESRIKDGLKMIGISDAAYWFSWFGIYGAIATFFAVVFTSVMYFMNVLSHISPLILFSLFWTFGLSVVTFSFALTPFFHKPKTAGIVGTLVLQFSGMLFVVQTYVAGSGPWLTPLRLISSLAFTTALDIATQHEYSGGIQWNDLCLGGRGEGILISLLFLLGDTFLYALMALYLDNVLPNEFGVKKHPLFCFMPSFWFGSKGYSGAYTQAASDSSFYDMDNNENIEPVPSSLHAKEAITVVNIRKTFTSWIGRQTVEAVKGISLKIYEGQITAILGRNGAGKSTLFNMITGMVSPTSGTTVVFGNDITNPFGMSQIRKMTGVCMQNDIHFSALTVEEHLQFYGKIRGLRKRELVNEIDTLLDELKLNDRRDTAADKLSGGQKRKLSIGIALIGDPKIILLDEPSAGVDPVSRRHLWGLLQRKKEGKVILLTTHFLDEADILADRKAIIHDGALKCLGSSLFLKNRFGVGYYLTVELEDRDSDTTVSDNLIIKWMPDAFASKKVVSNEIKYSLPHSEISKFPGLFAEFEALIESPNNTIKSYGVSMTTLEEVFLRISNSSDHTIPTSNNSQGEHDEHHETPLEETNLIADIGVLEPKSTDVMVAMCKLRILRMLRNPQSFFFMVFMPILFTAIGFILVKTQSVPSSDISLEFSPPSDVYPPNDLNIAVDVNSFDYQPLTQYLRDQGFKVYNYSGEFSNLLDVNPYVGTMGAITLRSIDSSVAYGADVRINGTFLHAPPILLNIIDEYYFTKIAKAEVTKNRLPVSNRPFVSKHNVNIDQTTFYAVFLIGPAFIFIAIGMVIEIVHDREIRARNHLRVNGLSFELYFGSMFAVYGALSLFVTVAQIALMYIFALPSLTNPYAMTVLAGQLLLYIPSCLLFSSIFSYFFDKMESAQAIFSQVTSLLGTLLILVVLILDLVLPESKAALIVHSVSCALDVFYIPLGIFYYANKQYLLCSFSDTCKELNFSNYSGPEFIVVWVCLLMQIPIYTFLLYLADMVKDGGKVGSTVALLMKKRGNRISSPSPIPQSSDLTIEEDIDVLNERQRVALQFSEDSRSEKCIVAVQDIVKHYPTKEGIGRKKSKGKKKVVNRVSFMIEEGEVFGLLGHNGAGKTTAMKIITAETNAESGYVKLCGYDISCNKSEAFLKLGYCPQHDALWENIKLKEHIQLYAVIRGVPPSRTKLVVKSFLDGLSIEEHSKKKVGELSGGTKRKLSYAMSMLGSPKIVLLDEPSTGMDPQSKRFLWNTILGTFKESRGALLTTHAMEEADALCSRIAIMVKGEILCVGSPQHLKSKFGTGYTLEVKMKSESNDGDNLIDLPVNNFEFILNSFPESKLSEAFGNRAVFSVPNSSIRSISITFALLEKLKELHNIEEYSFSQTTLEQVFLTFAKENEENEEK